MIARVFGILSGAVVVIQFRKLSVWVMTLTEKVSLAPLEGSSSEFGGVLAEGADFEASRMCLKAFRGVFHRGWAALECRLLYTRIRMIVAYRSPSAVDDTSIMII